MVRSVSISLCIISPFNSLNKCPAFDIEYFWSCALLTTEGTTMLASSTTDTSALNTSTFHTAGLLHNLGVLWLAGNWPEETSLALELATTDDSISTIEAFRSVIGTDYCQAGGILSRAWKLLEVLISAMEQHCHCVYSESTCQNTVLIGYAVDMVSALFRGQEERPQLPDKAAAHVNLAHLDEIYIKLGDKLNETQKLAHSMFSGSRVI